MTRNGRIVEENEVGVERIDNNVETPSVHQPTSKLGQGRMDISTTAAYHGSAAAATTRVLSKRGRPLSEATLKRRKYKNDHDEVRPESAG